MLDSEHVTIEPVRYITKLSMRKPILRRIQTIRDMIIVIAMERCLPGEHLQQSMISVY